MNLYGLRFGVTDMFLIGKSFKQYFVHVRVITKFVYCLSRANQR